MNLDNNFRRVLCRNAPEETIEHLIFYCTFSNDCWAKFNIQWSPNTSRTLLIKQAKASFPGRLFLEIFTIVSWNIWKEDNNFIFKGTRPSLIASQEKTKADFLVLSHRVSLELALYINSIVNSL